jgi:5'-nucleotidase
MGSSVTSSAFSAEPVVTFSSGRATRDGPPPDLRLLHYNDVYHLDPSSAEPVGGVARFVTVCKEYREGERFRGQPELITLFSGDVFNPSLESSITKGSKLHFSTRSQNYFNQLGFNTSFGWQAVTWFLS